MKPVAWRATHGETGGFAMAGKRTDQPANLHHSLPSLQAAHHSRTFIGIILYQLLNKKFDLNLIIFTLIAAVVFI